MGVFHTPYFAERVGHNGVQAEAAGGIFENARRAAERPPAMPPDSDFAPAMPDQPWYQDGLRFTCSQCGDCCTGAPGFVWVNKEEIAALATRMLMAVDEFERQYVRRVGIRKSLVEFPNGDCAFLDGQTRKCTVYEDRPRQCRTWPFWESNIRTPAAWQLTCEVCPGSGQGQLIPLEKIEKQASVFRV